MLSWSNQGYHPVMACTILSVKNDMLDKHPANKSSPEEPTDFIRKAVQKARSTDTVICNDHIEYYIHVLVPAIIHQFVQQDMRFNAAHALLMLEESADLGHHFNDDCDELLECVRLIFVSQNVADLTRLFNGVGPKGQ